MSSSKRLQVPLFLKAAGLLLVLCWLARIPLVHAQSHTDSLKARLGEATGPARLVLLVELVEATYRNEPERALAAGNEALAGLERAPNSDWRRQVLFRSAQAHAYLDQPDSVQVYAARLEAMADPLSTAHSAYLTARLHRDAGDFAAAHRDFEEALLLYEEVGDVTGQAATLNSRCILYRREEAYDEARTTCEQSLALKEEQGDIRGQASTLTNLATIERGQGNDEAALAWYQQAVPLYEASGDIRGQAIAWYWMGRIQLRRQAYDQAVLWLHRALVLREQLGDKEDIAFVLHHLGIGYEQQGDYDSAFVYHSRALALREEIGDLRGVAESLNQVGDLYEDQGDVLQARTFFQDAYDVFASLQNKPGMAATLNNTGNTYLELGELSEALAAYTESLRLSEEMGDQERIARAHYNMGSVYSKQSDYETALALYRRAQPLLVAEGTWEDLARVQANIGATYAELGKLDSALAMTNVSLALADSIGALPRALDAHLQRSEILEQMGRFEEALNAYRAYKAVEDSLYSAESQGVIAELQQQYRTREQARQIEALEQQRRQQRWWVAGLLLGLGLLLAVVVLLVGRNRLRRRALAAEAERAMDLRRTNEFQSRFLANISHEFRTPLTLTFGPINDLLDGQYQVEEAALPHLERARRNGQRLLRLINQLLELSGLNAGALHLEARRGDLARHLREIAVLFQDVARQRGLHFRIHLPKEPLWHVFDEDKIEKVVVNLLSNAVKFTPPGGTVTLSLRHDAEGTARIAVADTGLGIDEVHLPHLFDRFYQVERTETRAYEGSGIGLALVEELVKLHGGHITVESEPGTGSTFTTYLPLLGGTEDQRAALPEPSVSHGGDGHTTSRANREYTHHLDLVAQATEATASEPTSPVPAEEATVVLVVEDNADMRAYIRSHLEHDYTIVEATNGRVGLEQAQQWIPDLVLSDVMMPEVDGLALTDALKADLRTSHIPVVLLTAKAEVEHRIAGFKSGADAYLPKPFDAAELRVRVRVLLEERQRLRMLFSQQEAAQQEQAASALPAMPANEQAFLNEVKEQITHHLSNAAFGVDDLADALHLSRRQLLRKLKALTDESPGALLRRMRLEQALVLLREGVSAKEVAHAVGFRSYSAFWGAFNKVYGTSPTSYLEGW